MKVEAGVQDHRHAGEPGKFLDDRVEERVRAAADSLQARRSVEMDRSRNEVCFAGADLRRHGHERIELVDLKEFGYALFQDRRSKWTKPGTLLDARIEPILHFCVPRVGEDRAMAQCAGADFGAALEPADDLSRGEIARHLLDQFRLGQSLMR